MPEPAVLTLRVERPFKRFEEYTLLADKIRYERKRFFSTSITEVPLRFLDPTWVIQKGSERFSHLVFAAAVTAIAAALSAGLAGDPHGGAAALAATWLVWLALAPWGVLSWWKGRFDIVIFSSLHPQYGAFVVRRHPARELDVMQFVDAVSDRIKVLHLTKPEE